MGTFEIEIPQVSHQNFPSWVLGQCVKESARDGGQRYTSALFLAFLIAFATAITASYAVAENPLVASESVKFAAGKRCRKRCSKATLGEGETGDNHDFCPQCVILFFLNVKAKSIAARCKKNTDT